MTQFVLCSENKPLQEKSPFTRVSIEEEGFLSDVASDVFSTTDKKKIFTVALNIDSFDSICTTAQIDLAEGRKFSETLLFQCIDWLFESCNSLVFWYGGDYDDLDCVYDRANLLEKVEEALGDSNCEFYVRYEGRI